MENERTAAADEGTAAVIQPALLAETKRGSRALRSKTPRHFREKENEEAKECKIEDALLGSL